MEAFKYHDHERVSAFLQGGKHAGAGHKSSSDSRYRNIVWHLDDMFDRLSQRQTTDIKADLARLLDIMMEHVGNENSYMSVVKYPQAPQHGLHHRFICTKTAELLHRSKNGLSIIPEDLSYIRLLWLVHIQMYDQAFEEFIVT
ncbi:hypothetical protein FO488_12705 [Geobacter sp. FeAm09]|uniref:hypothetical protein n=1 Tax=Geobacter sp. FeAm09 TaxID=2597769 RepID=UPI0011EE4256|nr:hypothetical protein [Geobacter sp. FeAm09]QEM68929.1 hypothetical protein FO488_12705 [Geobacter sp. FeAm09]